MKRRAEARIGPGDRGRRLIDWLAGRFSYMDPDSWDLAIREGRLKVDGVRASADRILQEGERVAFDAPPIAEPTVDARYGIVSEDEDFLIIDKPPLLPCHPGGRFFENSLWFMLTKRYGKIHIATRLDRETSGLVLACRTQVAASHIQRENDAGRIRKIYFAIVHGEFPAFAQADGSLLSDASSAVRKKLRFVTASEGIDGERCSTRFFSIESIRESYRSDRSGGRSTLSLIRCEPASGRTHQLRATLLALGYPILGDKLYGLDETMFLRFSSGCLETEDEARLVLPFQALHCGYLEFMGIDGNLKSFETPAPAAWPFRPPRL